MSRTKTGGPSTGAGSASPPAHPTSSKKPHLANIREPPNLLGALRVPPGLDEQQNWCPDQVPDMRRAFAGIAVGSPTQVATFRDSHEAERLALVTTWEKYFLACCGTWQVPKRGAPPGSSLQPADLAD